jgi:hypothetical protein
MTRHLILLLLLILALPLSIAHAQSSPASQLETAINQYRTANGAGTLTIDSRLQTTAQDKLARMIATGCSLSRCVNEPTAYQRQIAAGYPSTGNVAELINASQPAVSTLMTLWTTEGSSSRFLLMLGLFTDVGCAVGLAGATTLFVCDFGQRSDVTPVPTPTPTATPVRPTLTPTPTSTASDEQGECSIRWRSSTGAEYARYFGVMGRVQCLGTRFGG